MLKTKYGGKFVNCLRDCNKSAKELLKRVIADFPCFDDSHVYKGHKVAIHKRAQILVADLWQLFEGQGLCEFKDIDTITMFADYRYGLWNQFSLVSCLFKFFFSEYRRACFTSGSPYFRFPSVT